MNTISWQLFSWSLELSSKCTLRCPRCPRTENPNINHINKDMTLDMIKKCFSSSIIKQVQQIVLCGDIGDPIYCKDFLAIISYLKKNNPVIRLLIVTNGSYKSIKWWQELGELLNEYDQITFSVDGYDQESNEQYRVNSDFSSILSGIIALRQSNSKVFIQWATIVFAFNEHHLDKIQQIATSLGCDSFTLTKSSKFGSKYGGWGGSKDHLEPSPQWVSSTHRYEVTETNLTGRIHAHSEFFETVNKFQNDTLELFSGKNLLPQCLTGKKGIYISAIGDVFPCVWLSYPYKTLTFNNKTIEYSDSFFSKYIGKFNIRERSIDEILNDPLWSQWRESLINDEKNWVECMQKCNSTEIKNQYLKRNVIPLHVVNRVENS